uniref:ShKT domain-containing protein n=1 Tax=Globodera rostochiensis TaxID=31243 RepID=A0A914I7K7_GLORO
MNARLSLNVSFLVTICLLLLLLNMNEVHGKKRRHRPVQRAAKISKSAAIDVKNKNCEDEQGGAAKENKLLSPWAWKSDNSLAFDIAITLPPADGNSTRTSSSNTTTQLTTMASSSTTVATEQFLLNDVDGMAQQQPQREAAENGAGNLTALSATERELDNSATIATTTTTKPLQTESWAQNAEEPAELARNRLKPSLKFTGANASAMAPDVGTLPPGIEPSPPAFVSAEELLLNNKLIDDIDMATQSSSTLSNDSLAADIGPRPPASRGISGRNGSTDSTKYWRFTRLPYINNGTEFAEPAPIVPFNSKAREEESLTDLELQPPHLGQADFFTLPDNGSSTEVSAGGDQTAEKAKCQRQRQESANEKAAADYHVQEPYPAHSAESTVPTSPSDTTVLPITAEGILAGDQSNKKLHEAPTPPKHNLISFDAAVDNKTLPGTDQSTVVVDDRKGADKLFNPLNNSIEGNVIKTKEENCCKLLRFLKGKRDNGSEFASAIDGEEGGISELFSGTDLGDQKIIDAVESNNKLGTKGREEAEANEEKLEGATVKAHWEVVQDASTTTGGGGGLEILKEELRERDFNRIQSHADSSEHRTPTAPLNLANSIETATTSSSISSFLPSSTTPPPRPIKKWTPYVFDCALEADERGESLCQEWAKGGLCEINRATRFLFCRKTCLCIGILDSANE